MTDSHTAGGASTPSRIEPSGPTASPWLRILIRCLIWTVSAVVLVAVISLFFAGGSGLLSAFFGGGMVIIFFTISLLIGHFVGRKNPTGALGAFAVAYVVKFVGFAALLITIGAPEWLDRLWFFVAALASVLIWQAVEVIVFSRTRQQIFNEPNAPGVTSDHD
ncbi:hypothetical protein [Psychromicrobium lacuslunae]|uniref:ATP synthase n=1 Tax=Psychromicrobium lacuslunae TaxID=1618207 RepID=A0A0D4C2W9_9MICC|nr:hypothetical protein [Psychromicrobium lacuslunae]AJT42958.1 hypothetical protein UM93_07175 [Psychromicrobium lacuslunae]